MNQSFGHSNWKKQAKSGSISRVALLFTIDWKDVDFRHEDKHMMFGMLFFQFVVVSRSI